jgi:glycosyltransferase involved in cell wall biosynthesis
MSDARLRVCLISPMPPPYGGVANWVLLLHKYVSSHHNVELECVDTSPTWRAIDDLALWKRVLGGGLQLIRDYARFLRQLRNKPDVVHLNTSARLALVRDVLILSTARRRQVPAVYHLRFGRVPQIAANRSREWRMLVRALRLATLIVAVDQETATTLHDRLPHLRVATIPNAFDPDELPGRQQPNSPPTVVFLGWVIPTKGVSELVQAWADLRTSTWRCVIAGPGSTEYRQTLLDRFAPRNLEFLPEQAHEDALALLAASELFVLPSYTEGFPNSVVEAMALGKAIIATEVGAITEMLSGGCGLTVPPRDAQALRIALERVMADDALRETLGRQGRERAEAEYSLDKVFDRLVSVWHLAANAGS